MPLDRYPVDPQDPNAWQAEWRREVERRLSELEAARPLGNTTMSQGSLTILNAAGSPAVILGKLDAALDDYGLSFLMDDGSPLQTFTSDRGMIWPGQPLALVPTAELTPAYPVTSGTFVSAFNRSLDSAMASAIAVTVPWVNDAGTAGEMRLSNSVAGGAVSATMPLPDNTGGGYATFKWLHQQAIGSGPFEPKVEVRRVSGAGNVYVWQPGLATVQDGVTIGATTVGF